MYRAHSKDINRNKSFHPLTYGNLRRVELLKEGEVEKNQQATERQKELQRDQEERRYDELVLANSADSLSGELARFRQTKNIFKAEYDAESAKRQQEVKSDGGAGSAPSSSFVPLPSTSPFASTTNAFLGKFKKEASGQPHIAAEAPVKAEPDSESLTSSTAPRKRAREDDETGDKGAQAASSTSGGATTGFVTSAESAQLRKELNLAQKQRHDPLMRVRQFQNSCVANAARQQQQQSSADASRSGAKTGGDTTPKDNSDALQSRIRELLALKKKK